MDRVLVLTDKGLDALAMRRCRKESQPLSALCSAKCVALNPPGVNRVNPLQRIQESAAEQDAAFYGW
jgi:hypothetical protein